MYLTGKSGKSLTFNCGEQLNSPVINNPIVQSYIKLLEKTYARYQNSSGKNKNLVISTEDRVTRDANINLYKALLTVAKSETYEKMLGNINVVKALETGFGKFVEKSKEEQVLLLLSVLNHFAYNSNGSCNLRSIGGGENTGIITLSPNIDPAKHNVAILDQDITGTYKTLTRLV